MPDFDTIDRNSKVLREIPIGRISSSQLWHRSRALNFEMRQEGELVNEFSGRTADPAIVTFNGGFLFKRLTALNP
jgi:hypothetical protein